ncbi:MAG: hypothetical protein AAB449_01945 [Patescibacteria group bacterium]
MQKPAFVSGVYRGNEPQTALSTVLSRFGRSVTQKEKRREAKRGAASVKPKTVTSVASRDR